MKIRSKMHRRYSATEDGFTLVAVMFMLAILVLSLSVAVPRIKKELQRDREVEATHRGKQYIRAIQLYYRKFHAYPPNLDALEKTNELRFLRKKYVDPITGKNDWKPIAFGQNKVPTAMGFFGQPLSGSSIAGTGPGNPAIVPAAVSNEGPVPDGSPSASSPSGQTFGGAGIIGFSIPSEKQSILVYKKQNHFNQWEFVYDPIQDSAFSVGGGGAIAGGNSGTPGSTNGNPSPPGVPSPPPPINNIYGPNGNLPPPPP
ncbi:MAG: type II secretion system protein, partial [Terracidiphilus sp.]